jgi:hypothetical protein
MEQDDDGCGCRESGEYPNVPDPVYSAGCQARAEEKAHEKARHNPTDETAVESLLRSPDAEQAALQTVSQHEEGYPEQ